MLTYDRGKANTDDYECNKADFRPNCKEDEKYGKAVSDPSVKKRKSLSRQFPTQVKCKENDESIKAVSDPSVKKRKSLSR